MTFTQSPRGGRLPDVEERRFRIASFFEWLVAAAGVGLAVWLLSVPVQWLMGPQVEATVDAPAPVPAGVPASATSVPVMYLLDGREIRHGDLHTRIVQLLPEKLMNGPVVRTVAEFGERQTRAYVVNGTKFYVVCERTEAGGPLRVSGIYLP